MTSSESMTSGEPTITPVGLSAVADRLKLGSRSTVAFVGGGGKTTTMFAVAKELADVAMTTTTKMATGKTDDFTTLVGASVDEIVSAAAQSPVLAWQAIDGAKALGYQPEFCDELSQRLDHVLVEADGARRRPFTAPGPFEPVIPQSTTHVVAMIGADAVGRCIGDQCHRPLRVAAVAGCRPYDRLTAERAATVLLSDRGLRKGVSPEVAYIVAIAKVPADIPPAIIELIERLSDTTVIPISDTTVTPTEEQNE